MGELIQPQKTAEVLQKYKFHFQKNLDKIF